MSGESRYADGQRLIINGGSELDRETLPEHWLLHPFKDGEVVEVLDLDHNTDEYDNAVYLVEAGDGVYGYVSEANLKEAHE